MSEVVKAVIIGAGATITGSVILSSGVIENATNPQKQCEWWPDLITWSSVSTNFPFNGSLDAEVMTTYMTGRPSMKKCKHTMSWKTLDGVSTTVPLPGSFFEVDDRVWVRLNRCENDLAKLESLDLSTWATDKGRAALAKWTVDAREWYNETYGTTLFFLLGRNGLEPFGAQKVYPLESLYYDEQQEPSRVDGMLQKFFASQNEYHANGRWQFGLLFEGLHGIGKTEMSRALAHKHGMRVFSVDLSGLDDGELKRLMWSAPPKSMFMFPDIEESLDGWQGRYAAAVRPCVTPAGILEAIDGSLGLPSGSVVILHSNNGALLRTIFPEPGPLFRAGRIDKTVVFGGLSQQQGCAMLLAFYPEASASQAATFTQRLFDIAGDRPIVPAKVKYYLISMLAEQASLEDILLARDFVM